MIQTFEQLLEEKYFIPRDMHKRVIDLVTWMASPSVSVGLINETTRQTMIRIAQDISEVQGRGVNEDNAIIPLIYIDELKRYNIEYDIPFENDDFKDSVMRVRESRKKAKFTIV